MNERVMLEHVRVGDGLQARIRAQLVQRDTALSRDVSRWKLAAQGTPFAEAIPQHSMKRLRMLSGSGAHDWCKCI